MKRILKLGLGVLLAGAAALGNACIMSIQSVTVSCSGPTCSGQVTVLEPGQTGAYGVFVAMGTVYCCTSPIPSITNFGGQCVGTALKQQKPRENYLMRAELLIPDCSGGFRRSEALEPLAPYRDWKDARASR